MGFTEDLQYRLLRKLFPRSPADVEGRKRHLESYRTRLERFISLDQFENWKTQTILDFGCGFGEGVIELTRAGCEQVVGYDIRPSIIDKARQHAMDAGLADRCRFESEIPDASVDIIVSVDAFEHFEDPQGVLSEMDRILRPDGIVVASFGPTWYHPRGGHLFSVFPWAHLFLCESALCRWRRDFRFDGAMRFGDVEGGLNQMTIRHFERVVQASSFQFVQLCLRPIRPLRSFHNRLSREFSTSIVDCVLIRK